MIAVLIAAVVVVGGAVTALALNFRGVVGGFLLAFGSEADYFAFVEAEELQQSVETATSYYGNVLLRPVEDGGSLALTVKPELTDSGKTLLLSALQGSGELDEETAATVTGLLPLLSESVYRVKISEKSGRAATEFEALCKGKLLAAVLAVADVSSDGDGKVYLSLPGLSDKVLIADSEEISLGDAGDAHFPIIDSSLFSEELIAALPTEKELNSLFEKYIKLALDNADDVTIEKSELTVDGVTQKCRVLKINVTEKTVLKIAEALLTELQKDKKVEKILKRIEKALPDEVKSEWDGDTLVSRFRSELAEGIEEIKSEQSALTGKGDTLLVLTDYIEDHQVIGRELSVPNGRSIASLTAEKGGKYASRFSFSSGEGDVVIAGSGNVKKGKLTGNYTVTVTSSFDYDENGGDGSAVSMEILTFSLIDFDTEKMKAGTPCGTVRLGLRNLTKLTAMAPEALRALDPVLELKFDSSETSADLALRLFTGETALGGVTLSCKRGDADSLSIPGGEQLSAANEEDMRKFIASIDREELKNRLSSLPLLQSLAEGLTEHPFGEPDAAY